MKKNILIIEAPFYAFFQYDQWNYAYSCAYYASVIKNAGHMAYIYDADKYFEKDPATLNRLTMVDRQKSAMESMEDPEHNIWRHYKKTLADIKPDVVLLSSWTFKLRSIDICIQITKELSPNTKIAVGGYHATAMPETFTANPLVDAVFAGPAEDALLEWLDSGMGKKFYNTAISKDTFGLTVHPDRTAFLYKEHYKDIDFNMSILSRGCHNNCSFCQNRQLSKQRHCFASEAYIREEIETVKCTYNNHHAMFADAHFFETKATHSVLQIIKEYNITWSCAVRIDALSGPLLDAMVDAGCVQIFTGIERGSDEALRRINKKLTVQQIHAAGKLIRNTNLVWRASFIIGFPDETYQSIEDTKKLALNLDCHYISLNSFTPLPGTTIWNELSTKFTPEALLCGYNQLNPTAHFLEKFSSEKYTEIFKRTLQDFEDYNDAMKCREVQRKW